MIESWGRGFDKIKEECEANNTPLPEYEISERGIMVLCKPGEKYLKLLKKYGLGTKEDNVPINVTINVPIKLEKIIRDRLLSMDYAQKKIERAIQIVSIIADNKNISMEDIAKNIGINSRTIKRDVDALKEICVLD